MQLIDPKRVQEAVRFLQELASAKKVHEYSLDVYSKPAEGEEMLRCAASLGYDLDLESIQEGFRIRMIARKLASRKWSTQSLRSR
jgi:hypothetical protein